MAKKLFEVDGGFSDGNIHYLSGSSIPGGDSSYQDAAPVGSTYNHVTNFLTYRKVSTTNTTNDWRVIVKSSKVFKEIERIGHGLSVGDWVYIDSSNNYVKGQADSINTADVIGVVETVKDANNFVVVSSGWSDVANGSATGSALFLSNLTAGAATDVKPGVGVQKNLGYVVDGKVFVGIDLSIEISSSEAPAVPLIVTDNITTVKTVARINTQEDAGALWVFQATSSAGRYSSLLHANHDGFNGGAATVANWSESAIVQAGSDIAGLGIGMSIVGAGSTQTLDVTVVSTDQVDVSVRQIKV